jgi:hypothetical protein
MLGGCCSVSPETNAVHIGAQKGGLPMTTNSSSATEKLAPLNAMAGSYQL